MLKQAFDDHAAFLSQNFFHLLLISSELAFGSLFISFSITAIADFPANARIFLFLVLIRLDLNIKQRNEKQSDRMVLDVSEQAIEDLTLLLEKEVLKDHLFLFNDHLLHDLEEVTAENGKECFLRL